MVENNSFQVMKDLQGYFKDGERKAIYNAAESLRDKLLIRLLWITGRRINEILNIKVHEIDNELKQMTIHIEKKTMKLKDDNGKDVLNEYNKPIRIKKDVLDISYIDGFTYSLIISYINENKLQGDDYLFRSDFKNKDEIEKPITRQRAFQIVRRLCKIVGIEKVGNDEPHPHHFRHSLAVDIAKQMKNPADVRKLQNILGHSSLAVTEQYLKFSNEEIRELINKIGD